MEKKLDAFGVFIIAFITALGGGTLRDVLIGDVPVSWMYNLNYIAFVLIGTVPAILFTNTIINYQKILLVFDSIGLGFFTVLGIEKGIALGLHPVICIILGTITACFGGVIRDISLNNIPLIFQKEIYATACIFGGIVYFILIKAGVSQTMLQFTSIASIVFLRLIAVKYNWRLPVINSKTGAG